MKALPWVVILMLSAVVFHEVFGPYIQRASFQRKLKQRLRAEELQSWALKVIQEQGTHDTLQENSHGVRIHPALEGLFRHPPHFFVSPATEVDRAFIRVTYGGGSFGHFGVEVGPTNRPMPESSANYRRYNAWAPGVYFFDGQ